MMLEKVIVVEALDGGDCCRRASRTTAAELQRHEWKKKIASEEEQMVPEFCSCFHSFLVTTEGISKKKRDECDGMRMNPSNNSNTLTLLPLKFFKFSLTLADQ